MENKTWLEKQGDKIITISKSLTDITHIKESLSKMNIIEIVFIVICIIIFIYWVIKLFFSKKENKKDIYDIDLTEEIESEIDTIEFNNSQVQRKYLSLFKYLGSPTLIEQNNDIIHSVTWHEDLDETNFEFGKYNGLDYIKINSYMARKKHPIPAPVYIIVGKYINVPEHLYGPLKYASPTINIEQLYIPKKINEKYEKTGIKEVSLVTGSCASITISTITVKFVEDMIKKYKKPMKNISMKLHIEFRDEYDKRILNYLCGKGIKPRISWYKPDDFGESAIYNSKSDKCGVLKKTKKPKKTEKTKIETESEEESHESIDSINKSLNKISKILTRHNGGKIKACSDLSKEECNNVSPDECLWETINGTSECKPAP